MNKMIQFYNTCIFRSTAPFIFHNIPKDTKCTFYLNKLHQVIFSIIISCVGADL